MTRSIGKGSRPKVSIGGPQRAKVLNQAELETLLHGAPVPDTARNESPEGRLAREAADEARANIEAANRLWQAQVLSDQQPNPPNHQTADTAPFYSSTRKSSS